MFKKFVPYIWVQIPVRSKKKNAILIFFLSKSHVVSIVLAFYMHKIDTFRTKEQLITPSELGDKLSQMCQLV